MTGEKWKLHVSMEEDMVKIADKIEKFIKESKKKREGWKYMQSMLQATITVDTVEELWGAYQWFAKQDQFKVLKVKDGLNEDWRTISATFVFDDKMIGEIAFRYGK